MVSAALARGRQFGHEACQEPAAAVSPRILGTLIRPEADVCGIMGGGGFFAMLEAAHQTINGINVAIVTGDGIIASEQDVLDLLGSTYPEYADAFIIGEENLPPEFFALRTRLAGNLLQKFVNYHVKVAVIGDFTRYESKALRDFIYECNQGRAICFVPTREEAIAWLSRQR